MKRLLALLVLLAPLLAAADPPTTRERYDKFKGFGSISVESTVQGEEHSRPRLISRLVLLFEGKPGESAFKGLSFRFVSLVDLNAGWKYLKNSDLDCIVDGKKVAIGTLEHDGSVEDGYLFETMGSLVPTSLAKSFAEAKLVECRLGFTEFTLSDEAKAAWRAALARTDEKAPPKEEPQGAPKAEPKPTPKADPKTAN